MPCVAYGRLSDRQYELSIVCIYMGIQGISSFVWCELQAIRDGIPQHVVSVPIIHVYTAIRMMMLFCVSFVFRRESFRTGINSE